MDGLQQQINTLNQKVDQLHQIVERLSGQLTVLTTYTSVSSSSSRPVDESLQPLPKLSYRGEKSAVSQGVVASDNPELVGRTSYSVPYPTGRYRATMEHKDVLLEDEMPQTVPASIHEPTVSSDIQIRRLMAQLTAAYNRIAILEEQLIACRMHS